MRIILQRVSRASVTPSATDQSTIGAGVVLLVGFAATDADDAGTPNPSLAFDKISTKLCNCRIFSDNNGKLNNNISEIGGDILVVPQFTLYANTRRGRRPDFNDALEPTAATVLFDQFVASLTRTGIPTVAGVFGADMDVELVNDGPLTLLFDF